MFRERFSRPCGKMRVALMLAGLVVATGAMTVAPARAAVCQDGLGLGWSKQCPEGPSPDARFGAAMAELPDPTNPLASMIVLFGGCGQTRTDPTTASFEDGSTATAPFGWCPPTVRDPKTYAQVPNLFDDTWIWQGDRWRKVPKPSGASWPRARWNASMTYDRTTGAVILFGGLHQTTGSAPSDPGMTDCWDAKVVQRPDPKTGVIRYQATPITSVTVPTGPGGTAQPLHSACFGDTWLFDGTTWTRAQPAAAPSPRFEHAMSGGRLCVAPLDATIDACGPRSGQPTVFSGCEGIGMVGSHGRPDRPTYFDCSDYAGAESIYTITNPITGEVRERKVTLGDTWTWDGTTWTRVCPGTASSGCRGLTGTSSGCTTPRVEIHGISLCGPAARRGATMAYNPATGGMLLFGGYTYDPVWDYRGHKADTWQWDADALCPDLNDGARPGPCWRLLMADWKAYHWTTPHPGGRAWAASTAAGAGGQLRVIMFGGNGYTKLDLDDPTAPPSRYAESLRDTWVWMDGPGGACVDGADRYDTTCWQPCPTCVGSGPGRRAAASLAYDASGGKALLFGGVCDAGCGSGTYSATSYQDTWAFLAPALSV